MNMIKNCKRIVIKVGTSTLTYANGSLNLRRIESFVRTVADFKNAGHEVVIVSSGAVAAGYAKMALNEYPKTLEEKQACAAVGQSQLMKMYENFFYELEANYPERFKCFVGYSDPVAQKIYAGSDIFLMPSKFEPCGLGQMIAMRYATLPLVRETGGLKDTVIPYNKYTNEGTGFSFDKFEPQALKEVMYLAIDVYNNNKEAFNQLRKNAMKQDYSWSSSAKQYIELYNKITK